MSYQFYMTFIESHNDAPLDSLSIDIAKDTKILDDTQSLDSNLQDILSTLYANLKDTYTKHYAYHYLSLQLDSNALILILLIPQSIPKVYKELYKDYTYKDYGIGKYHCLYNSCTHIMLDIQDYTQIGLESNPSNATILTLHTPYKTQRALMLVLSKPVEQDTIGKKYDNNITQVKLDSKLSKRTITFTNRFKLLKHQENTSSGFSATLFKDTQADSKDSEYILAFRGTEFPSGFSDDVLDVDADLANSKLPSNQYIDMIKFYTQCIADKHITESTSLESL